MMIVIFCFLERDYYKDLKFHVIKSFYFEITPSLL